MLAGEWRPPIHEQGSQHVWVQELYIDEFDGGGGLSLQQLTPTLNVVRLPSPATMAALARFLPTLLYGPTQRSAQPPTGSLVVTQQSESGAWEVLDLCRLPLEGLTGLSDLQIFSEHDEVVDSERIFETLEAIDGPVYRAVFTDEQPMAERLSAWRAADWIVPLLRRPAEESDGWDNKQSVTEPTDTRAHDIRLTPLRRAQRNWGIMSADIRPFASRRLGTGPSPPRFAPGLEAAREAYFRSKQEGSRRREQIRELRGQLQVRKRRLSLLDQAVALQPIYKRRQSLASRLAAQPTTRIDSADVKRVRDISRRLVVIRRQQRALSAREQADLEQTDLKQARLRRTIGKLHRAAQEVRSARRASDRFERANDSSVTFLTDPRVECLRRRVKQLRTETRRMLQRQLLSRRSLIGVGLLFSAGAAILASSLLVGLEGTKLATATIGFICMIAAALLKCSFERTPTFLLRRQRLRIASLLAEVDRIRSEDGATRSRSDVTARPVVDPLRRRSAAGWRDGAEQAWVDMLTECDLAPSLSPVAAVRQLRSRLRGLRAVADGDGDGLEMPVEQVLEHQRELRRLKQQRRAILRQYRVKKYSALEKRLKTQRLRHRRESEHIRLQAQLESLLPSESDRLQIDEWLEGPSDLAAMREIERGEIAQRRREMTEAQRALVQEQATTRRLANETRGLGSLSTYSSADANGCLGDWPAFAIACAALASLQPSEQPLAQAEKETDLTRPQPLLLRLATKGLRMLWNDPSPRVGWDDPAMGPYIEFSRGRALRYDDLAVDQQHSLVIALQCALVRCLTKRIGHLPLVLTDRTFTAGNEPRFTARLLHDLAKSGQQIFVVTESAKVSERFHELDLPALVVTRQDRLESKPSGGKQEFIRAGRLAVVRSPQSAQRRPASVHLNSRLFRFDKGSAETKQPPPSNTNQPTELSWESTEAERSKDLSLSVDAASAINAGPSPPRDLRITDDSI